MPDTLLKSLPLHHGVVHSTPCRHCTPHSYWWTDWIFRSVQDGQLKPFGQSTPVSSSSEVSIELNARVEGKIFLYFFWESIKQDNSNCDILSTCQSKVSCLVEQKEICATGSKSHENCAILSNCSTYELLHSHPRHENKLTMCRRNF